MGYHSRKKRYRLKPLPILIAIIIVSLIIAIIVFLINNGISLIGLTSSSTSQISSEPSSSKQVEASNTPTLSQSNIDTSTTPTVSKDSMWSLILVNRDSILKKEVDIQKTKFDNQYIDSRIADAYQKMYDAAKADGITLFLRSGYRAISLQTTYYESNIDRYMKEGHSKEESVRLTEQYYARPGASEHHTGLAADIITPEYQDEIYTLDERFAQTKSFEWLTTHSAEYGFILRYPKDKVDITKINYEPWHYRYVGVEHAKFMTKNNLCLEEYVEKYQKEHPELME